jgi:hypothetical protein
MDTKHGIILIALTNYITDMPAYDVPYLTAQHYMLLKRWGKLKCRHCGVVFKINEHLTRITTSSGTKYYHDRCLKKLLH